MTTYMQPGMAAYRLAALVYPLTDLFPGGLQVGMV